MNHDLITKLESLNPNRIDEERMKKCHSKFAHTPYKGSITNLSVEMYNSTLPEVKELEPLPSAEELEKEIMSITSVRTWNAVAHHLVNKYSLPTTKNEVIEPSIEPILLKAGDKRVIVNGFPIKVDSRILSEDYYQKYFLPKREWWMDLKEGDKFVYLNKARKSDGKIYLFGKGEGISDVNLCAPYIEPSTREKLLDKLDDEGKLLLEKLLKEK